MELLAYLGRAADRNPRAMQAAPAFAEKIGERVGVKPRWIGTPRAPVPGGWSTQLAAALPDLQELGTGFGARLDEGERPVLVLGRCAASIATLPDFGRRHREAMLVWFDAHGDINVPDEATPRGAYLGGMVITGAAGRWETGLGAGLDLDRVVLVGARDLDPPEQAMIARGEVALVGPGPDLAERLREAIGGRAVYVHIDCDVLDAGLAPSEYQVAAGLSFADVRAASAMLAEHDVLGLEISEFEGRWPDGTPDDGERIVEAVAPLLDVLTRRS